MHNYMCIYTHHIIILLLLVGYGFLVILWLSVGVFVHGVYIVYTHSVGNH